MVNKIKFNRSDVINKATELFWQQGFQGTSMRDLQEHLDMRPGSIYATFDSKENLYKEVINCYAQHCLTELERYQQNATSPFSGLKAFISDVTLGVGGSEDCRLCLLAKTLSELSSEQQDLIITARQGLRLIENKFAQIFQHAITNKQLPANADCHRLAKWLQMQIMGLRAYAKSQPSNDVVKLMIEDIFIHLSVTD